MRLKLLTIIAGITFLSISCSPNKGGQDEKKDNDDEIINTTQTEKFKASIFSCSAIEIDHAVEKCLSTFANYTQIMEEILTWSPTQGNWNSLQLKTQYFRKKYQLSQAAELCLEQVLCKQPIFWKVDF